MSKKRISSNSTDKKQSLTLKVDSKNEEPKQKSTQAVRKEAVLSIENLSDEDITSLELEKLPVEKDGTRILNTIEIAPPEGIDEFLMVKVPILTNPKMAELNVVLCYKIPITDRIPVDEVKKDITLIEGKFGGWVVGDEYYFTTEEVFNVVIDNAERCGVTIIRSEDDDKSLAKAISAAHPRKDGYYDDLREYWYEGCIFHEKDVIWFTPLYQDPKEKYDPRPVLMNIDADQEPLFVPCDITRAKKRNIVIENGHRVLNNEETFEVYQKPNLKKLYDTPTTDEYVFWLAKEYAKTQDTVGYAVVCFDGKFYVPCESFFDESLLDFDHLIVMFNAVPCLPAHHLYAGTLQADIGNMTMRVHVRCHKGSILNWATRRDQEILASKKVRYESYSPYDDPYDDPTLWWYFERNKDYDDNNDNTDNKNDDDDDDDQNTPKN